LFLLISFKEKIESKWNAKYFKDCFKYTYDGLEEEDIDLLVISSGKEVQEITSKEFKTENKANKEAMTIVTRIEKNSKFKELFK